MRARLRGFVRLVALASAGLAAVGVIPPTSAASAQSAATQVTTDKGAVVGSADGAVRSFYGIPYAAPPTGENRWASPKPAAKWDTPSKRPRLDLRACRTSAPRTVLRATQCPKTACR